MILAYQLTDVHYSYGHVKALSLTNLGIQANKITALVGPNGCGKSTLLNLLAFLQENQTGQIRFFDKPVSKQLQRSFAQRIAFLPQKPFLLRGTVKDNLNLLLKFNHINHKHRLGKITETLKQLDILHLAQQQAKCLSGGELQKVALARAIIINPDVLLMDEPFSYLDHNSEKILEEFIQQYVKENNKTLIFSTHNRLQGLAIADDIISLVKGKLVQSPLINVFHGNNSKTLFNTGKIIISLTENQQNYHHVSIDPSEIVLSTDSLVSSMRNQFQGQVKSISDESGKIRITILAGEIFQVLITYQALQELDISLGDQLWISFKSNSVVAF